MTFDVQTLANRYGVGEHTVLTWIRRGELRAIDVSRRPGGRPRWRVTQEALEVFERGRQATRELPRVRRKRRQLENVELPY